MSMNIESAAPLARPRRGVWRPLLAGMAILLCGMAIGSGLTLRVLWVGIMEVVQHPEQFPERASRRVGRVLDLTPEQMEEVKRIMARRQRAIEAVRRQVYPRIQAEMNGLRDEVAAALPPESAEEWTNWFERLRARWWPALLPESPAPPE